MFTIKLISLDLVSPQSSVLWPTFVSGTNNWVKSFCKLFFPSQQNHWNNVFLFQLFPEIVTRPCDWMCVKFVCTLFFMCFVHGATEVMLRRFWNVFYQVVFLLSFSKSNIYKKKKENHSVVNFWFPKNEKSAK